MKVRPIDVQEVVMAIVLAMLAIYAGVEAARFFWFD